jgi:hypothetical protein
MDMLMHSTGVGTTTTSGGSSINNNNNSVVAGGGSITCNGSNANGEDLVSLEAEITELQRENARVESEMLRLKSNIQSMETQLHHGDRVCSIRLVEKPVCILECCFVPN